MKGQLTVLEQIGQPVPVQQREESLPSETQMSLGDDDFSERN